MKVTISIGSNDSLSCVVEDSSGMYVARNEEAEKVLALLYFHDFKFLRRVLGDETYTVYDAYADAVNSASQ